MNSFLITIDKTGLIEQVIWSDPDRLVPGRGRALHAYFAENARAAILKTIKACARSGDATACDTPLQFLAPPSPMALFIAPMDRRYLAFAVDDRELGTDGRGVGYRLIVRMFMNVIRNLSSGKAGAAGAPDNIQIDMIKTLTNELRNRKRQLEEANARMNRINEDLNNRLVTDALTGLTSRYQYREEIEYRIAGNPGKLGVFIFLDIDDFKAVNDRHGHGVGDKYLMEFADRLRGMPVENMIRMRISGDEFGLFVYGLEHVDAGVLEGLWRMIGEHVLSRPIVAGVYSLPVAVSAGMSVYGADTLEIYELIEYADYAMYTAKRRGKNRYGVFNRAEYDRTRETGRGQYKSRR